MKRSLIVLAIFATNTYAQLGWEPYTGQPTQTLYGAAAGAGLGYFLAPAISKGPDAQWIGALTGMTVGGLLGNYMSGDNINHQKLQNSEYEPAQKPKPNIAMGIKNGNTIRSPYSDYSVSTADFSAGSVVSDPISGGLFRIPR